MSLGAKRSKCLFSRLAVLAVTVGVFGCGSGGSQTITSPDSLYTMVIPSNWSHDAPNPDPSYVMYDRDGRGIVISVQTKTAGTTDDLNKTALRLALTAMLRGHTKIVHSPSATTIGGYPARQFEFISAPTSATYRWRQAVVSTPDGEYAITLRTNEADADGDRASQDAIFASFHHK